MSKNYGLPKILMIAAVLFSGCGPAYSESGQPTASTPTATTPTTTTPVPTTTAAPASIFTPSIIQTFNMTASGVYTVVVNTDNLLQVQVTAQPDPVTVGNYTCAQFSLQALGNTQSTGILAVNGGGLNCSGASSTTGTIDFSTRLSPGHGPVTITISNAQTDYQYTQCMTTAYGYPYPPYLQPMYGCSMYYPVRSLVTDLEAAAEIQIMTN